MTKDYVPPKELIITPSGMRGIVNKDLNLDVIKRFTQSFGLWLGKGSTVLLGRDTRSSGIMISSEVISSLNSVGVNVLDAGMCPTPALLFYKRKYKIEGSTIVSGSHNPPQYNGIKYLSRTDTFLGKDELKEINNKYFIKGGDLKTEEWNSLGSYKKISIIDEYMEEMKKNVDFNSFVGKKLKVIVDHGAGAGINVTEKVLRDVGCEVTVINGTFTDFPNYPRPIEPIKPHLTDLSDAIKKQGADLGFAHDCDADRVAIIDSEGTIYPEDTTVALLIRYLLENNTKSNQKFGTPLLVTNSASSLMFEKIAEAHGGKVVRTPVGERYLAIKMNELKENNENSYVFGGEGSSGGFMYPQFNNARDGIFAAVKMCELVAESGKSLKELVSTLPEFFRIREKIRVVDVNIENLLEKIKKELRDKETKFVIIDRDIKIVDNVKDEWTLLHPSNTEPVIRVITEATTTDRAQELCNWMGDLIKQKMK